MQTLPSELVAQVAQFGTIHDIVHLRKVNKKFYEAINLHQNAILRKFVIQEATSTWQTIAEQAGRNSVQWGQFLGTKKLAGSKILVFGPSKVGKTSLMNALIKNQPMVPNQMPTIGIEFVRIVFGRLMLQ